MKSTYSVESLTQNTTPKTRKSAKNTLKKRSSPAHSSALFDEENDFEGPTRCRCQRCEILHPTDRIRIEGERVFENVIKVQDAVDQNVEGLLNDLQELISFKSISVQPEMLAESMKALDWLADRLDNLKFQTMDHYVPDDPENCFEEPHRKVLFSRYFSSPTKNTVLIYGHLDVVPAKPDCWLHDPFTMHLEQGVIYGRGVTSGKGMLVGWLQAIECWLKVHGDLPINVKIIVDMLHEVGNSGLHIYVKERKDFFLDVDFMVFDANSWLNNNNPIIACSLSGWAHFGIEVRGGNKTLESGLAGGLVFEPMIDLCHLMNSLVNDDHDILIPNVELHVKALATHEWQLLEKADFQTYAYKEQLYIRRLRNEGNKVEMLQNRWCKPTLTMHGVEGADSHPGCRRMLPMRVVGKFSIKLVPDQDVKQIQSDVNDYLERCSSELDIGTKMTVHLLDGCEPSSWSSDSTLTKAVINAVFDVFQKMPIVTEGIPICLPVASVLGNLIDKPIMLVPYWRRRDHHHQENEYIEERCVMQHAKVCANLFYELSVISSKCKCHLLTDYCNRRGIMEKLDEERGYFNNESPASRRNQLMNVFRKHDNVSHLTHKRRPFNARFKNFLCIPFAWKRIRKHQKH
ncbi:cytosolic non-specific dipeptidase-like [Drosophila grimshawi]|uniref:GH11455 n=1 Tax=Drosophila grimshawi TaxID=7222 RepID=B4JAG6_DROGR|nr:cytosolic non-specific dipeptidase-like [Drosophila grimshawi]EDW03837.1 GH11455 [Drosophila grimshawi]